MRTLLPNKLAAHILTAAGSAVIQAKTHILSAPSIWSISSCHEPLTVISSSQDH